MPAFRNGTFVSLLPDVTVTRGGIDIHRGIVRAFGPEAGADGVDLGGALVLPGLVNAHTHLYSSLAVGMPAPAVAPTNFAEILERVWWKLDRALDLDTVRLSALVGGQEAARSGVTVLFDHHASPNAITGSLKTIDAALDEVGIDGVLCYEVTDRGGAWQASEGIAENLAFIRATNGGLIGGHAAFTLSDATLGHLAGLGRELDRGFHIHAAEDVADAGAVARLDRAGLLGPGTILAHGVHLDDSDLALLKKRAVWLVHNPRSNMNNAVGYAQRALSYGMVALGTDGIGCDVLAEARVAFLQAREAGLPDAWGLPVRLLQGSLWLAEQHMNHRMGAFTVGDAANLVITDYVPPTPLTADNFAGHLLFGFDRSHIREVYYWDRCVWPAPPIVDPAAAARLWERMNG